jgi:hypothetical protein
MWHPPSSLAWLTSGGLREKYCVRVLALKLSSTTPTSTVPLLAGGAPGGPASLAAS